MNPLYQQLMSAGIPQRGYNSQPLSITSRSLRFQNPMQKMQYIMQAIQNPVAFIRQAIPGIPEQAYNDPTGNSILQYMMRNMGVTSQDIQNAANSVPRF